MFGLRIQKQNQTGVLVGGVHLMVYLVCRMETIVSAIPVPFSPFYQQSYCVGEWRNESNVLRGMNNVVGKGGLNSCERARKKNDLFKIKIVCL